MRGRRRSADDAGRCISPFQADAAEPGSAYLSEQTAKLVSGFFQLRDLSPFNLKGVTALVRVYELEGVSALQIRIESHARAASHASSAAAMRWRSSKRLLRSDRPERGKWLRPSR